MRQSFYFCCGMAFIMLMSMNTLLEAGSTLTASPRGSLSAINRIDSVSGEMSLMLSGENSDVKIATVVLSSNYENAFELTFEFANGGKMRDVTQTGALADITITSFELVGVGGILGAGLSSPSGTFLPLYNGGSWQYVWNPGVRQMTNTREYEIEIRASWDGMGYMKGVYTEEVNITLGVGDGT